MKRGNLFPSTCLMPLLGVVILVALSVLMNINEVEAANKPKRKARKVCGVDCHQDTKEGFLAEKSVHPPIKKNQCDKCHDTHGLIPGRLLTKGGKDLCYICHQKSEIEKGEKIHSAINRELACLSCHDPHASEQKTLLKESGNSLCFSCHAEEEYSKANVHKPLEKGCQTCHDPHSSDSENQLTIPSSQICIKCHDVEQKRTKLSHMSIPIEQNGNCTGCHTPHSSEKKALIKQKEHPSIKECNLCHNKDRTLVKESVSELCYSCHQKEKEEFAKEAVHQKVKEGDCLSCHAPHASEEKGLLTVKKNELCLGCHTRIIGTTGYFNHTPSKNGECQGCHLPHSSDHERLLKTDAKTICDECHDRSEMEQEYIHDPVKEGNCIECHNPHGSRNNMGLQRPQTNLCTPCHSSAMKLFSLPNAHRPVQDRACGTCHAPHSSKFSGSLLREKEEQVCSSCHPETDVNAQKVEHIHPPFGTGNCSTCHDPHVGETDKHLVTSIPKLCYGCHDSSADGENTHVPFSEGNCTQCHSAHASNISLLLQRPADSLCFSCHKDTEELMEEEKKQVHIPFKEGKCLECHFGHGSDEHMLLTKKDPEICLGCHTVEAMEAGASAKAHLGKNVNKLRCLGCHEPHYSSSGGLLHEIVHPPFAEKECSLCH